MESSKAVAPPSPAPRRVSSSASPQTLRYFLALMVALVSIALYLLVNKGTKTEQVPYVVFPASLQDAAAFIPKDYTSQRKPIVVKNSFVVQWEALTKWTNEYLTETAGTRLFEAKVNGDRLFRYFNSQKPLAYQLSENLFNSLRIPTPKPLSMGDYFRLARSQHSPNKNLNTNQFAYLSTNMENVPELLDDIPSVEMLRVVEGGGGYQVHLWVGDNEVTAQTHFDESHNFYVQIRGHKTFILSPPSEHWKLCYSPHLHPLQRESQLLFNTSSRTWNPNPKCPPMEADFARMKVTLTAGDILYIPPYWAHTVVAEGESVSVNVWSESSEGDDRILMEYIALPFEEEWTREENVLGLNIYLCQLVDKATGLWKQEGFHSDVVKLALSRRFFPAFGVPDATAVEELTKVLHAATPSQRAALKDKFSAKPYLDELIEKLRHIEDMAIREQALTAYLETAIHLVLGVEDVHPMLAVLASC